MTAPRPYTLIAEITYRCPLHCVYCSNPTGYRDHASEMPAADWLRVLDEAAKLGVVQTHFTGGEPLARSDLEALVERAHARGMYVNLVTSGVPFDRARFEALAERGLDHVQVSFQGDGPEASRSFADLDAWDQKIAAAQAAHELDLALTVNVVLHRGNLDQIPGMIALAERLGAERLELANVQFHGFAFENRGALVPTADQLDRTRDLALAAKERLRGKMDVLFVKPDHFSTYPRACMDGWARRFVQVIPDGTVVPCHAATSITTLSFERVSESRSLVDIWETSPALEAFRGDDWMSEPCKSCERKSVDFGGCRCQAFALLGDASLTDPACSLSPRHDAIARAREEPARRFVFRGRRSTP